MSDTRRGQKPTGSRRFWLTVTAFALANALAWAVFLYVSHRSLNLVHIVRYEPGHSATTGRRPTLQWEFNLNMERQIALLPGQITPEIAGKWVWKSKRLLAFEPSTDLPPASKFVVKLNSDRLRTPEGLRLDHPFEDSFFTTPLQLLSVRQAAWTQDSQLVLELQFNDTVSPLLCLQHLRVTDPTGRPVECQLTGQAAGKTVRVQTAAISQLQHASTNQFVTVELTAGLAGASGPLATAQPSYQRVDVAVDLMASGAQGYSHARDDSEIRLEFNNLVDAESIRQILSIEPAIPFELSAEGQTLSLRGAFSPGARYVLKLAAPPPGANHNKYPRADLLSVFMPDRPAAFWFDHPQGYLGTNGNRTVLAHAVNMSEVKLSVIRMYDNNLVCWRTGHNDQDEELSQPICTKTLNMQSARNQVRDIPISLDDLLPVSAAHDGVYELTMTADETPSRRDLDYQQDFQNGATNQTVITLSDIGLTARQSDGAMDVWAVSLSTAKPLPNIEIRVYSNKNQLLAHGKTDSHGLLHLSGINPQLGEHATVLLAELAEAPRLAGEAIQASSGTPPSRGLTWLDLDKSTLNFSKSDTGGKPYLRNGIEAFIYTERGVYRPGDMLHVRGIARAPALSNPGSFPVRWQLLRPDLRNWQSQMAKLDANGDIALDLALPEHLPTGRWIVELQMPTERGEKPTVFGSATFEVQEFVPNRMKMSLAVSGEAPASNGRVSISNGPVKCQVQADYLFGEPAADRPVKLTTKVDAATFAPPQWPDWTFGDSADTDSVLHDKQAIGSRAELEDRKLDARGHAIWHLSPEDLSLTSSQRFRGPWKLSVFASVIDAGGRAISANQNVDLDMLPNYLGARLTQTAVEPSKPITLELAKVQPNGQIVSAGGSATIQLYRQQWNTSLVWEQSTYHYNSARKLEAVGPVQTVQFQGGHATCQLTAPLSGDYVILARDAQTGFVTSYLFGAYHGSWDDNIDRDDPENLQLSLLPAPQTLWQTAASNFAHPTAKTFLTLWQHGRFLTPPIPQTWKPGQPAQIVMHAPFAGSLLLSFETDKVVSTQVIALTHSQMAIPIVIPANLRPNAYITATVVRAIDPDAPWRTHRAYGIARLALDSSDDKLDVQVQAPPETRPDNTLAVRLRIRDPMGQPAPGATVNVMAVDEGILTLTDFHTPDPLKFFWSKCAHAVAWSDLYSQLMPEVPHPQRTSPIGGDKDNLPTASRHQTPVSAKRVKPVAMISPLLHADSDGWVQADFQIPEFSGQLRIMAVADRASLVGSAQSQVSVRAPLMVQSSWPRFAAPEDQFSVPLTIFNFTGHTGAADITVDLNDDQPPLQIIGAPIRHWTTKSPEIPAGAFAEIALPIAVKPMAGVAHIHLSASLNHESWQESLELPIRPPSPQISIGGYAIATPAKPATMPIDATQFLGGTTKLQVHIGPLPTLQLPQGLEYLDQYPYGCAEQTVSGCFPLLALSDLGATIAPAMFTPQRMNEKLQSGIIHLIGMQTAEGGVSMWPGFREPTWPWASVYAAHFVIETQRAGYSVPRDFRDSLLSYVRSLLEKPSDDPELIESQCYGCYVLALAGQPPRSAMSRLTELVKGPWPTQANRRAPSGGANFHLAAAWLAAGRRDLAEGLIPDHLPSPDASRQNTGNLASPIQDRSVLLSTLLDVEPDNPAIPSIAQEIAEAGRAHHWQSTQDTALAVMALGKYLRQAKPSVAYTSASIILDGQRIAESTSNHPLTLEPKTPTVAAGLQIQITGPEKATAYVSWLLSGVPMKSPTSEDAGLTIRRQYLNAAGNPIRNNSVASGDLVQIELTLHSPTDLDNVVVDDLLPAGLEIENARLQTTAKQDQVATPDATGLPTLVPTHIDVRDDRLILVGHLSAGRPVHFTYLARALTPGTFIIPPVRAECMYDIGIHSISGGAEKLTITPLHHSTLALARDKP